MVKTFNFTISEMKKYNPVLNRQVEVKSSRGLHHAMYLIKKSFKGYEIDAGAVLENGTFIKVYPAPEVEKTVDKAVDDLVDKLLEAKVSEEILCTEVKDGNNV